jgi:hypothetical protein
MDTNSIQPFKNNELVTADSASDLSSFGRYFLSITSFWGIFPLSLFLALIATAILPAFPQLRFYGWAIIWTYCGIGVIAAISSIVTWNLLRSFDLPRLVRLSISIWTPSIIGLVQMLPMITLVSWKNVFSDVVFLMFMMPSIAGGIVALLPYYYRDYLESKNLIPAAPDILLHIKNDDGQQL